MKTNEPVAWMQHHYETEKVTKFSSVKVWEDDIPLYNHPAKTLTDEEIHYAVKRWEMHYNYKHDADVHESLHEFARAILRKAQEK
jgi:hypothetical protein